MRGFALASLSLAAMYASGPAAAQPRIDVDSPLWRLESEDDGIRVYSAEAAGTAIIPFKAVVTLPASIEEISAVLEDDSRRAEWVARFGGSVQLERRSDFDQVNYVRMRMPWPLTDRTAVVRVSIHVASAGRRVIISGRSTQCCDRGELPKLVRAQVYESTFEMVRTPDGTRVTALVFVDPRGNLPSWVVNLFTGIEARRTLAGLSAQVARRLYSRSVLDGFRRRIERAPVEAR